ncbi:MAG: leucine-rich repeat domain-containing protein [Bacteroidaceae bacterium]|nr:leucine-rich repeat domain-containing protein [Bacteroidaceae bacterium]
MKKKIMTMAMMALAFTACTKEDLMPPTQGDAGTLHITSVTIDGQQVARTRMVADDGEYIMSELPYNQSFNGFAAGDWLKLDIYNLYAEDTYNSDFKATYGNEGWSIGGHLRPIKGMTWADVGLKAGISVDRIMGGTEKYSTHADNMGVVQGDIDESNSYIYGDWLTAETNNGTITIDTDVKSPTLGAVTIRLKHAYALLRLPQSAANVTPGTYIVNGTAHNVTGLGTLWAVLNMSSTSEGEDETATTTSTTIYCPLTKVTIGEADFLQAIVPADNEGDYTLTGFKAVMLTEESGASGEETTQNSELTTQNSLTLDLPFKVGTENSSPESEEVPQAEGYALQPNHQYPLTLNIAPHTASVTLSSPQGKPGWGTDEDEEELSNEMNEIVVIDGTDTDVATVKAQIETALAAGKSTIYVTGEMLEAYSNGTAKSVVGEAICLLAEGTTVSLLLPEATMIGEKAFYSCTALKSVSAPKATMIRREAFHSCTALTSVELPAATSIGELAFQDCSVLTSVSAPKATSIGESAFRNCSALESVSLPAATSIGDAAFSRCGALESVSAPKALTIGDSAFDYCNSLTSVSLPEATSIGMYAFYNCTALTSLTFGSVITSVGNNAFLKFPTENCALTLNSGQQNSTVPVSTDEDGNPTWAGYTWASISYVDDDGNAVEGN